MNDVEIWAELGSARIAEDRNYNVLIRRGTGVVVVQTRMRRRDADRLVEQLTELFA